MCLYGAYGHKPLAFSPEWETEELRALRRDLAALLLPAAAHPTKTLDAGVVSPS